MKPTRLLQPLNRFQSPRRTLWNGKNMATSATNLTAAESGGGEIDTLIDKACAAVRAQRGTQGATYRLQFHTHFTFRDACRLVPYLHDLGITHCYASPYLKARPGSMHGYDISDHQVLNPEIGSDADFEAWVADLHRHGMGQIVDIVPNHMGIVGNENAWWNDVLENGPSSRFAGYFDIDWYPAKPALRQKVLLSLLGRPYGYALEAMEITLCFEDGAFLIRYFEHRFPIAPESSLPCLRHRLDELESELGKDSANYLEYLSILTALTHLPPRTETEPAKMAERIREKEVIRRRLAVLTETCAGVRDFILRNVVLFNGMKGKPASFDLLDQLLDDQSYRLSYWRVAADEINYRRFFDVNDLAALNVENPEVFRAVHALVFRLTAQSKISGLRVDHVDGLYDPRQYLERLQNHTVFEKARELAGQGDGESDELRQQKAELLLQKITERNLADDPPLYVAVEKILGRNEAIPEEWATQGTTGYDFLKALNGLFVDSTQEAAFSRIYRRWGGAGRTFRQLVYEKKFLILQVALASELHMLARQLDRLSEKNRRTRDFTLHSLRHALREIIACFPVYRSYIAETVTPRDRQYVEVAVRQARQHNAALSGSIFEFVRDMLLLHYPENATEADRAEQRRFVAKFQQVTGPVMAKGMEDTAFYVYNRLVSLNEVGGDPGCFGAPPADLHHFLQERSRRWPYALSATTTHDTKRSEDVRARLNILSEIPHQWQKCLARWQRWNKRHRSQLEGLESPDRNDEYLVYQTLIGAWPLGEARLNPGTAFVERMSQYMTKASREAKVHTSWINPQSAYDNALCRFVTGILDEKISAPFLHDFRDFQARVSHWGLFNSLAQTLLKIAAPGIPDFYQGTEIWDLSLVDPDNRRPVDYQVRQTLLKELKERRAAGEESWPTLARELVATKEDGRIKFLVTYAGLECRRSHHDLFARGAYLPAIVEGSRQENAFAFIRRWEQSWAVIVVPRLITRLTPDPGDVPMGPNVWQDDVVYLPDVSFGKRCRNIFTGETLILADRNGKGVLRLAEVLAHFPVALLLGINH